MLSLTLYRICSFGLLWIQPRPSWAASFIVIVSKVWPVEHPCQIYGSSIDSLDAGLPYPPGVDEKNPRHQSDVFARAFASAQYKLGRRQWAGPVWPLLETFGDSTADDNEVIDGFIEPLVKHALAKKAFHGEAGVKVEQPEEDYSLLSSLLTQTDSYKVLRDETFNVLLAGLLSSLANSWYW